jgi:hypothetical protein
MMDQPSAPERAAHGVQEIARGANLAELRDSRQDLHLVVHPFFKRRISGDDCGNWSRALLSNG